MKRFTPVLTFFAGCGFMLLISAKNQTTSANEIPRYQMSFAGSGNESYVYDAITGEVRIVGYTKIKNSKTLKAILEETRK